MNHELREELAAIFDKDRGVSAPPKAAPKRVPSSTVRQDEILAIQAIIEQHNERLKDCLNALQERYANEVAPFLARLRQLREQQG